MNKGIELDHPHGVNCMTTKYPDIGWILVLVQNNPENYEREMIGRWVDDSDRTITHIEPTEETHPWPDHGETNAFCDRMAAKVKKELQTSTDREITDKDFEKIGFDISKEPFTKEVVDGTVLVYKNKIRDGSGRYDGYCVIKPEGRLVRTWEEFLAK